VARIKDSSVDAVKAAIDMVELVSAYTPLRRVGARYTARCPFHEERTPSFSVNAVDKLYYCFGCGAKGDAITFVREKENLDFAGAIEWLAERFHFPLEREEVSPAQEEARRRRDRLHALLEQAASFYERYLWESAAGEPARAYLAGRGFGEEVLRLYRLGLSPSDGRRLTEKAREKGFTDDELRAAGLLNRGGYDTFQGRLMFPLADARGRVLGFQARKLRDDDPLAGKYVNSPEGELFQKGAMLYGLDRARAAIAREDCAIVVEGNPDVLALRQAGFEPVVASMGTALTERQLKELRRLTTHVTLCFDGDAAGEAATLRGMDLAVAQGLDVQVVALPPGVDPADAAGRFGELLAGAKSYPVYRVDLEVRRLLPDKQAGWLRTQEVLARFPDSPDRQEAVRVAADLLGLPPELQAGLAPKVAQRTGTVSAKALDADVRREQDALAGVIANPALVPSLAELTPDHFDLELHRRVRNHLVGHGPADEEVVGVLAQLDARAASEAIDEATAKELLLRLRERAIRRELGGCEQAERIKELQTSLARIREAIGGLG
jgi:DNA primase